MRGLLISVLVFAIQSLASLALANEPAAAINTTDKMTITGGDGNTVTLTGSGNKPSSHTVWSKHTLVGADEVNAVCVITEAVMPAYFWDNVEPNGADVYLTDSNRVRLSRYIVAQPNGNLIDVNNHKIELHLRMDISSKVDMPVTVNWGDWSLVYTNEVNIWDANYKMVQTCDYAEMSAAPHLRDITDNHNDMNKSANYTWGFTHASTYSLSADTNYNVKNIVYDSATGKYWWAIENTNTYGIYLASASSLSGEWTIGSVLVYGDISSIKKFGSKWYLYYTSGTGTYYKDANDINGNWSVTKGPLIDAGTYPGWDAAGASEVDIFERNGTYYLFYTSVDDPNYGEGWSAKVGYATSASVTGPFTKYEGNPVLSGGDGWNNGNYKAADPYVFQLDSNTGVWFVGYTACATSSTNLRVGFASTTDFITFTDITGNPILGAGLTGSWDNHDVYRGGRPLDVNGILYIPYTGVSVGGILSGGIGILSPCAVRGKIGGGVQFNGNGNFTGTAANLNNATISGATISFWANINTTTTSAMFEKGTTGAGMRIVAGVSDMNFGGKMANTAYGNKVVYGLPDYRNQWTHYAMRWNNGTDELSLYIDGVCVLTGTDTNNWPTNTTLSIGATTVLKGIVDEVSISDVDRGADWIYTSYQNQNDPEGFWSGCSNIEDLDMFCEQWLKDVDCFGQPDCPDLNHDDYVNFADYAELVRDWGI